MKLGTVLPGANARDGYVQRDKDVYITGFLGMPSRPSP